MSPDELVTGSMGPLSPIHNVREGASLRVDQSCTLNNKINVFSISHYKIKKILCKVFMCCQYFLINCCRCDSSASEKNASNSCGVGTSTGLRTIPLSSVELTALVTEPEVLTTFWFRGELQKLASHSSLHRTC